MKNTRKNIKMANIFIISHLFDDIWLRYLNRALRAPSTFANDSSMLSSILLISIREIKYYRTSEIQPNNRMHNRNTFHSFHLVLIFNPSKAR